MPRTTYETLTLELRPDRVGVITLQRPAALNALNTQMMTDLRDCFTRVLHRAGHRLVSGADRQPANAASAPAPT